MNSLRPYTFSFIFSKDFIIRSTVHQEHIQGYTLDGTVQEIFSTGILSLSHQIIQQTKENKWNTSGISIALLSGGSKFYDAITIPCQESQRAQLALPSDWESWHSLSINSTLARQGLCKRKRLQALLSKHIQWPYDVAGTAVLKDSVVGNFLELADSQ